MTQNKMENSVQQVHPARPGITLFFVSSLKSAARRLMRVVRHRPKTQMYRQFLPLPFPILTTLRLLSALN